MSHRCDLDNCDGTRLGHDLAQDFPAETARISERLAALTDRAAHPDDYVKPENLQVEEQ